MHYKYKFVTEACCDFTIVLNTLGTPGSTAQACKHVKLSVTKNLIDYK